jgi:hypothetical protein
MHLLELAASQPPTSSQPGPSRPDAPGGGGALAVPGWALGCFRRRCITFFDGSEDTTTEVLWLQSHGSTADFRRRGSAPRVESLADVERLSEPERVALARVEGGIARTHWDGRHMTWTGWDAFQNHARWPEPGRLERVGHCLVEHAPSGAYVEDWRVEPCGTGPLIGLRLIDERERESGALLHRGGGLVVCGQRAAFVRGRPAPLPEGERLEDLVRGANATPEQLAAVFSCDAAFAEARGDVFRVTHATLPWREGRVLVCLEGFEHDRERPGHVVQRANEDGRELERRFVIDTLLPAFEVDPATPVTPEGAAWLAREREALLGLAIDPARPR